MNQVSILLSRRGLRTLTFNASSSSSTDTIAPPAGAKVGDFAVLHDVAVGSTTPTSVVPVGWGGGNSTATSPVRGNFSFKILTQDDLGVSITGMNDTTMRKVILCFTPDVPLRKFERRATTTQGTTADPTAQVTTLIGAGDVPMLYLGFCGTNGTAAFTTASPAFDATVGSTVQLVGYKVYNFPDGPADHTVDTADTGTNILQSCVVMFR